MALWVGPTALATPAYAYSSFGDYLRPIDEGGGGGRLFTGTPADPYTCEVCHRGAEGAPLAIVGLPEDGYLPGQTYEVSFVWPETEEHIALMAEFTDLSGGASGEIALATYETWLPGERCENEFPAADVCLAGSPEAGGCCRELDPTRNACSFPGQRGVFWVLDCRSRSARLFWTAPAALAAGEAADVWFSAAMVTSDINNDALGDGVTLARRRLHMAGSSTERTAASGNCSLGYPVQRGITIQLFAGLLGLIAVWRRRVQKTGVV